MIATKMMTAMAAALLIGTALPAGSLSLDPVSPSISRDQAEVAYADFANQGMKLLTDHLDLPQFHVTGLFGIDAPILTHLVRDLPYLSAATDEVLRSPDTPSFSPYLEQLYPFMGRMGDITLGDSESSVYTSRVDDAIQSALDFPDQLDSYQSKALATLSAQQLNQYQSSHSCSAGGCGHSCGSCGSCGNSCGRNSCGTQSCGQNSCGIRESSCGQNSCGAQESSCEQSSCGAPEPEDSCMIQEEPSCCDCCCEEDYGGGGGGGFGAGGAGGFGGSSGGFGGSGGSSGSSGSDNNSNSSTDATNTTPTTDTTLTSTDTTIIVPEPTTLVVLGGMSAMAAFLKGRRGRKTE